MRVFIAGTEYRAPRTYSIRERSGQVATADFSVLKEEQPVPRTYMLLEFVEDDLTPIFTGIISEVDSPAWSTGFETYIISLKVRALEELFRNRLVRDVWEGKRTHEIVDELFDTILLEEGLSKGTIETFDRYYEKYVAAGLPLDKVLKELGDAVGAVATIGADKVFRFRGKATLPTIAAPEHIRALQRRETGGGLVTVQRLTGANEETTEKTVNVTWAANQETVTLGYQVASITGITINGVLVDTGVLGLDSGDPDITFLYRTGERVLTLNDVATTKPAIGDNVVIVYFGNYSIEVESTNEALKEEIASLSGTSGIIEKLEVDTSIENYADGEAKTTDLLNAKGEREEELSLEWVGTDLWQTDLLTRWTIDRPDLDISGDYIIVSRTIQDLYDQSRVQLQLKKRSIFSRAGEVLDKHDSTIANLTVRVDDLVAKTSSAAEDMGFSDAVEAEQSTMVFFPATGGDMWSPATIPGFYPV